jgi:hypothetical protein
VTNRNTLEGAVMISLETSTGCAGWISLSASPVFALMAWITPANEICSPGSGILPIGGMTAMYLLMSLFHLSPWLRLASGHTGRA